MTQSDPRADALPVPAGRSGCPLNLASELFGDRWSLLVLRDLTFGGPRHYRDLLASSREGIASNILTNRLSRLTEAGLLTRHPDPDHRQKVQYRLTEAGIQLVPVLVALGEWGNRWLPVDPELAAPAVELSAGGPPRQHRFMDQLRTVHLQRSTG